MGKIIRTSHLSILGAWKIKQEDPADLSQFTHRMKDAKNSNTSDEHQFSQARMIERLNIRGVAQCKLHSRTGARLGSSIQIRSSPTSDFSHADRKDKA
jgi:hypothetical protein